MANQFPTPPFASVFAVIDTAAKTGTDNDGTAVPFFAVDPDVVRSHL